MFSETHEYDPRSLFRNSFGVFIGPGQSPDRVVVRLSAKWKHCAPYHRWHESQQWKATNRVVEVTLHVRICEEVRMWVPGFGPDAAVLEPASLRQEIATLVKGLVDVCAK